MDDDGGRPFVSVKFTRVGRIHNLLLPEPSPEPSLAPGDEVVVRLSGVQAYATVVQASPVVRARRPPHPQSPDNVIRRMKAVREESGWWQQSRIGGIIQLSAISCQLSASSRQLSATNHQKKALE